MTNRITKQEAARIAGVHEKTLERYISDGNFQKSTGYVKSKINGRVTFDETLFRSVMAESGAAPDPVDPGSELTVIPDDRPDLSPGGQSVQVPAPIQTAGDPAKILAHAFLIPHKVYLTLDEAKALTNWPKTVLKAKAKKIHGRWLIKWTVINKL